MRPYRRESLFCWLKRPTHRTGAAGSPTLDRPMPRQRNMDPARFEFSFPEATQRQIYAKQRSLALDALGWALCQTGNCADGETRLAQAVDLDRSEQTLSHWA